MNYRNRKIMILGSPWKIVFRTVKEDDKLRNIDGYADFTTRTIVVEKIEPDPNSVEDIDYYTRTIIRHEIVHAFMFESGRASNSTSVDAWAVNEEMIDWISLQGVKLYKAWEEAEAV